jgi:hypothetical protein
MTTTRSRSNSACVSLKRKEEEKRKRKRGWLGQENEPCEGKLDWAALKRWAT